jgi:tellurite resistance protein TerC
MSGMGTPALWAGFLGFVLLMLALDLGVFHRRQHVVGPREAAAWSATWIALALGFGAGVFFLGSADAGEEFLAAYLVEKSLSVDNLFVFVVLFEALRIPRALQHRVLFWGILTALVLRGVMIFAGAAMLARFHWLTFVFGGFLIFTGWKLWTQPPGREDAGIQRMLRLVRRVLPTTPHLHGAHFLVREHGHWHATPMLVALAAIELSDVAFAVDSIPAVFAVSRDPFIVFTSNIFAILGLRSLYFLLADLLGRFTYLRPGLAAVLTYVGVKMVVVPWVKIPAALSLGVIATILAMAVGASILKQRRR